MIVTEIHKQIKEFIVHLIPYEDRNSWNKAELYFDIQPNTTAINGRYYLGELDKPIEIRDKSKTRPIMDLLRLLHNLTTENGLNKWNRALFTISPQTELESKFQWDQEWQQAEDDAVKKVQEEDPSYIGPKWHWEE